MPGQLLVTDPGWARLTVRFGKQPAITIGGDAHPTLMDHGVMPLAEQDQIANTALHVPKQ